jgi:hypothetical protein
VNLRLSIPVGATAVVAIAVSLLEGVPARLPSIALGSEVLLYAERAAALFALAIAAVSVSAQAARGRLPTQLSTSGIAYEAEAAAADAVSELQHQVQDLERAIDAICGIVLSDNDPAGQAMRMALGVVPEHVVHPGPLGG